MDTIPVCPSVRLSVCPSASLGKGQGACSLLVKCMVKKRQSQSVKIKRKLYVPVSVLQAELPMARRGRIQVVQRRPGLRASSSAARSPSIVLSRQFLEV